VKLGRAFLSVALFLCSALGAGKATAQNPKLIVRADQPVGSISPYVYGANYGPWSMVELDMLLQAKASGVTYLRFPGGNWGDENDLQPYHIDPFMAFAHLLHAEPSISVRLKGGTPEKAAQMVHYVNVEKRYGVRYWSIGNEPNLYRDYTVERYNRDWRAMAQAMLTVDPKIILVGPDVSQYPPLSVTDPDSRKAHEWLRAFLQANGDLVSIVSIHRYPFPKGQNQPATTIAQLKGSAREWDAIIPDLRRVVQETTGRDLPVAVTEVNSHWSNAVGGEASLDSYYNAIWWADVLGRLIRQRVDIVAFFALVTYSDIGGFGLLSRYDVRPTYYVYKLYQQLGTELLATETTDADVTITAARRSDGTLTLLMVNAAVQPKRVTLSGIKSPGQAELWRLDPDHKAEKIGSADLTAGSLDLPAQSASLYIIP
jgi:hypothetical protein